MAELELAAIITQFVVHGKALISNAVQIYQSASGVAQENAEIELAAENFEKSREKLKNHADNSCDETLLKLCRLSNDIAHDMLEELNKLKVPGRNERSGNRQRLLCLWAATRGAWKKDYIQAQKKRLEYLEKEIVAYVTIDHRDRFLQYTENNTQDLEKLSLQGESVLNALANTTNTIEAVRQTVENPIKSLQDERDQAYRDRCLEKLPVATSAHFNSYDRRHRSSCLPHTREETLCDIKSWVDGDDEKSIFWLNGLAGTGKSSIANTIAHEYYEKNMLGGSFFFSKDIGGDVTRARKFFTTLARQLARISDIIQKHISKAVTEDETILDQSLPVQWRKLILNPLLDITANSARTTLVIVVDALDECRDVEDVETIVRALAESRSTTTLRLRVLLTSRSYFNIRQGFRNLSKANYEDFILHDISRTIVDRDIGTLVKTRFEAIQLRRQFEIGWPGNETVDAIVQRAKGLFIWADTACRFIEESELFINKRLRKLLEEDNYKIAPEERLDSLYLTVLKESISPKTVTYDVEELEEYCKLLKSTLGAIAIMFSSVSILSLSKLTGNDVLEMSGCLEKFTAILDIREERHSPVRLHHPSFRDFLLNQNRCIDKRFVIDETEAHADLACYCMDVMSSELKRNMCDIRQPGRLIKDVSKQLIEQCVSEALQYACQYWVYHLHRSKATSPTQDPHKNGLETKAYGLLRAHLTHWLEALSLIGRIPESIHSIKLLEAIIPQSSHAFNFIYDARRFIQSNIQIFELAPLQIYCTSLLFAPQKSLVRNQFQNEIPRGMQCLTEIDDDWGAACQNLEGHTSAVRLFEFSADGTRLKSGADDNSFALWDVSTGQAPQLVPFEASGHVDETAVSLSSELLAIFMSGKLILWDLAKGLELKTLEEGIQSSFKLQFSGDGKLLASTGNGNTLSLWDMMTGKKKSTLCGVLQVLQPYELLFAPSNKFLACQRHSLHEYEKNSIELYDITSPESASRVDFFEIHGRLNEFHLSDTRLILMNERGRVDIWSTDTKRIIRTLNFPISKPETALSPRFDMLYVSATDSDSIELWDLIKVKKCVELEIKFESYVWGAVFSPDGSIVAARWPKGLLLWDVSTGLLLSSIEGPAFSQITGCNFSPDNKLLAGGYRDGTIRLWDLNAQASLHTKRKASERTKKSIGNDKKYDSDMIWLGRTITIGALDLSVVPYKDGSIEISSFEHEKFFQILRGNGDVIRQLEYLKLFDRHLLISLSSSAVRVWDIMSGVEMVIGKEHEGVLKIQISPSGKILILVFLHHFIISDIALTEELQTVPTTDCANAIACSADNKLVVWSCGGVVTLWSLQSRGIIYARDTCDQSKYSTVAFTSDSDGIAYSLKDGQIGIWRISTKDEKVISSEQNRQSRKVDSLEFSPDDSLLATASWGRAPDRYVIALHSVATGECCAKVTTMNDLPAWTYYSRPPCFSSDGQFLNFHWGQLCLGCLSWVSQSTKRPACKGKGLFVDGPWVMQGQEKVLWLPLRYRPESASAHDDVLLIKHEQRRLTKLRIDVQRHDFWEM